MSAGLQPQVRRRGLPTILWPALGLGALLLFNFFFAPGFFRLQVLDGHLYGTLIDILNQGSKVMLLALGMTLVIATGGVDPVSYTHLRGPRDTERSRMPSSA